MAADRDREVFRRQVRDVAGGFDRGRERLQSEQLGPVLLDGLLHLQPDDRIGGRDLGADEQEDVGLHEVLVGDRPAVGPLHAAQRAGRVHVPITGRAVQVVRADRQAHELLEDVQVLVGAAGRDEPANGFGAVRQLQLRQPLGERGEHLVPRGGVQLAVRLTVQRTREPVLVGGVLVAEEAPRAQVAVVAAFPVCRHDLDDFLVAGLEDQCAPVAAVAAGGVRPLHHPGAELVHREPARDRAHRADLHAAPAELAVQLVSREVHDLGHRAPAGVAQRLDVHDLVAVPHAAQAGDAAVHLLLDQRAEELFLIHALGVAEDAGGGRVLVREVLEVAASALVADRAVERVVRQDEFQHGLVGFVHDRRVGPDHHALGAHRATGGLQLRYFFDLDQAHAAVGVVRELGVVAEVGDHDPEPPGGLDDEGALLHHDRLTVDQDIDHVSDHVSDTVFLVPHRDQLGRGLRPEGAALLPDVRLVFVPEVLERAGDRRDLGVPKGADRAAGDVAA